MPRQEEIELMIRLAILEKENGREVKQIRESYKSDYIGIPHVKNGTAHKRRLSGGYLGLWAVCRTDFILAVATGGQAGLLGIGILTAYLTVLLVTLLITGLAAVSRYHRSLELALEYEEKPCQAAGDKGDCPMRFRIRIKRRLTAFYSSWEGYVKAAVKFFLAFAVLWGIQASRRKRSIFRTAGGP